MVHFQPQPEGLGLFSRPTALKMTYAEYYIASFLPCRTKKYHPAVVAMKDKQTLRFFSVTLLICKP